MAKYWICSCYCIPWVPRFRLICIKPVKTFSFLEVILGHKRSLKDIGRLNIGFAAATVFPEFLALI